jgi:hypothetical protein
MRSKKQYRKKMNSRKKRRFRFFSAGQGTKRAPNPLVARPPPTIDELLRQMEEGESSYKPKQKIKHVPGMPLLEKYYMVETENDRRLKEFHKIIEKKRKAYEAELAARDKFLKENPMKVNESQESLFSRPEKVGPQRATSYIETKGVEFNLEGKEPKDSEEYGYYELDFRGGKKNKKNKTKKRRHKRR